MLLEDLFSISQSFTDHCRVVDCEELDDAFKMEKNSLKTPYVVGCLKIQK